MKDFGWDQGYRILDFTVKGGKRNRVAIHPDCSAALDLYLATAGHAEDRNGWLFRAVKHAREGARMHRATLDQIFRRYAAIAKLPDGVSPHSARRDLHHRSAEPGSSCRSRAAHCWACPYQHDAVLRQTRPASAEECEFCGAVLRATSLCRFMSGTDRSTENVRASVLDGR